jgi:phosphoserine phosphatase
MNRLRVGIAGLGRMGRRHAENLARRVPQAELVAACDPGADELAWAQRQLGVAHCYTDYAAMLAQPDLEAVFLVTPTTLHAQQIVDALRARKHVFSEKPLSLDIGECQRVEAEAALQPDLKVMIGFVRRFDTSFRHAHARIPELAKVDEIPFDFERRIMSVVVRTPEGKDRIIAKGAPEAIFPRCASFQLDGRLLPMDHQHVDEMKKEHERLCADGFRVLAIASKDVEPRGTVAGNATLYGKTDEHDLVLQGYAAFLDPPKETANAAIGALHGHGVSVKILTGDNDLVARKVCGQVGLPTDSILLGAEVDAMSDDELADAAEKITLFARVSPANKQRIIRALQARRHTVGFMGDGINDAPALHTADVGISVDMVGYFRKRIFAKLGIDNVADLVKYAIQAGLTPLG